MNQKQETMEVKYDVYTLRNARGEGEERTYVRLQQAPAMRQDQLLDYVQQRCSLTRGDVAAVLAELHDLFVHEFSQGHRVYLPEIGYFSMSAGLEMPEDQPDKKITAREVRLTGINFKPEAGLMQDVQEQVHFVRSRYSSQSTRYTAEQLLARIREYLADNRYITCRMMRTQFGLTQYMAQKWLDRFCAEGVLVKDGARRSPIYFPA